MTDMMWIFTNPVSASFLLAFPALFSIVNPLAGALIYHRITLDRTHSDRVTLARRIAIYSATVMLISLWVGASVLSFFGITISALRIAGGFVVAVRAWQMLSELEVSEDRKHEQAAPAEGCEDVAFFPLTIPFTTGPGTISVAIALGANRPTAADDLALYFVGVSAAALIVAATILIAYAGADRVVELLGQARARVVTRLSAFILLCVGTQILMSGVIDAAGVVLERYHAHAG
jgi:multiple antibiotic resistance protein